LQAPAVNAYPRRVGTLEARPRSAVVALIGMVLVWSVVLLTLPRADGGSFTGSPEAARIGPLAQLAAIASDRPTTTIDAKGNARPRAIPAMVSTEAGTRAALLFVMEDLNSSASLLSTVPLGSGLVRRGPPLPSSM
jgi:hypothetical protein